MLIEYSKDIVQPPDHLTAEFFEETAENSLREGNLQIKSIKFTMGSSNGENYCSQIYRVKIFYKLADSDKTKELSVIVKSMPFAKSRDFVKYLQMYLKEKMTYFELLPRMEIMLDEKQKFGARLYHCMKTPVNTLIFEDLAESNFEMASRESGLDLTHATLVMRKLAKFHGISMVIAKKDPEITKYYNIGILHQAGLDNSEMILRFFSGNAEALVDLVSQWKGYEEITTKLRKYCTNLRHNLWSSQAPHTGELKVINHGDLWVNNMLFKYDQHRNVRDVIFVDYQLSVWCSPGIDLNYFFYTSLQLDILKHKRDELLKVYHKELTATLKNLNYQPVPSYEQIREEVRQREAFGFFANYAIFPVISLDKEASSDNNMENLSDEDFARKKFKVMFSSKRLEETMRYTLKEFDKMGILD